MHVTALDSVQSRGTHVFSGSVRSSSCGDLHHLPNGLESQQSGGLKRKIIAKYPVGKDLG